jgi:hypothetical protein
MALESASFINGLNASNPTSTDGLGQADDHIRLLKNTIKSTFPNVDAAVTPSPAELNTLDGYTGNTADFNILSGASAAGLTAAELLYVKDVTSDIQAQINSKASSASPSFTGTLNAGDAIVLGSWTIYDSGGYLYIKYGTDDVFRFDSNGHFRADDDISAFETL